MIQSSVKLQSILSYYFPKPEKVRHVKKIKDGIDLLEIDNREYVLKLYPQNIDHDRINFFEDLQNFTSERLKIAPRVIRTVGGETNIRSSGGIYELTEYLENIDFDPKEVKNINQFFYDVGYFLGRVHRIFAEYSRSNKWIFESVLRYYLESPSHLLELLRVYRRNGIDRFWVEILKTKIQISKETSPMINNFENFPRGVVHGDFYPKNLLFDKDMRIVGLIDYAQAGEFFRCYEVIRAIIQTNKYLGRVDLDPKDLQSFIKGYLKSIKFQQIELERMLDLFIFIQASDISFNSVAVINGSDEGLKDYAKYRFDNLVSLYKNRNLLNTAILKAGLTAKW